jgi:folate-binding protein YgfZ
MSKLRRTLLFDLSNRGRVVVTGRDRSSFLHALLTNRVKGLEVGMGCYTCFLTTEGRMVTDFYLYQLPDRMLLDISPGRSAALVQGLEKYLVTEDVQFHEKSEEIKMLSIQGPNAREVLREIGCEGKVPDKKYAIEQVKWNGVTFFLIDHPWTVSGGYDLFVERASLEGLKREMLEKSPVLTRAGWEETEVIRIEAGIARFNQDMDEHTIPTEAGLDETIDHDKGCYVGQEIIARIRDRGHVSKLFFRFELEGKVVPEPETPIYEGESRVGTVTSAIFSPNLERVIALGYVKWDYRSSRKLQARWGAQAASLVRT